MSLSGVVTWHGAVVTAHVRDAALRTLTSASEFGHSYWDNAAPISTDRRTSGDLRASWASNIHSSGDDVMLTISANTRYAIYVELGTSKMGPRAPLRATAAEITAILPIYLASELADIT